MSYFMSEVEAVYLGRSKTEHEIVGCSLELSSSVGGIVGASTTARHCKYSGVPQDFTAGGSHGRLSETCHTRGEHRREDTIQLSVLHLLSTSTSSFCPTVSSLFV